MARALRIEARIFLLQLLCMLMILQGEPLLALDLMTAQRAARPAEEADNSAAPPQGWTVDPPAESAPDLPLPAAPASVAPAEETNPATGSVWSRLLAATRFAVPARPELPPGEADWKEIASKRFPVDGQLGTFDPTLLINGLYDLRLEAVDVGGLATFDEITVSVEGNMKIGNFTLSFADLEIDVAGIPIQVIRTYDSRRKDENLDFGYGWPLDIRQGQYRTNGPVGRNWQIVEGVETAEGFPVHIPCHDPVELKGHTASVRLSDQEYFRFRPILYDMGTTPDGCFAKVGFAAVSGFTPGAKLEVVGGNEVFYVNDTDQLVNLDTLDLFDPGTVRLTTRDGRTFEVDKADGIRKIRDSNDNQLTITAGAITHSSGLAVALVREQGRVTKITDVLGHELVYDYDGEGDLVTFTDREKAKTRFLYGEHYLESIVDPLGCAAIRNEYGDDGRLTKKYRRLRQGNPIRASPGPEPGVWKDTPFHYHAMKPSYAKINDRKQMNRPAELTHLLFFFANPAEKQWSFLPTYFPRYWIDVGSAETVVGSPQRFLAIILSEHLNEADSFLNLPIDSPAWTFLDELRVLLEWFVLNSPNEAIFSRTTDPPHELHLIWKTVGRLCNLALAELDTPHLSSSELSLTNLFNKYGKPLYFIS